MILQAVVGGFVLDALFGDPAWLPHPVVLMGRCISRLEKFLRARLPGTPQGELLGGAVTAFCLPVGTFLVTSLVCLAAAKLSRGWVLRCRCSGAGRRWRQGALRRRAQMCITSWFGTTCPPLAKP